MAFTVEDSSLKKSSMEEYVTSLRKSVQQTKCAIAEKLKKREHRFRDEINNCEEDEKKTSLMKKLEKISKELQVLDNVPEDEIVRFALYNHNVMAVACNRRCPKTLRMKARVASHKPLSTHLARIKSKLREEKESKDEEETKSLGKSLNKMCVNNQIVKMRKNVKQSKVHIIHKLTRYIKILRASKGKNKEKYEKKADRLVKKLKCIKNLHEDDISRFALTCTEDLAKLSTDAKSPLKSQVMATIALHKFVALSVGNFKNAYPDLTKNIPTVLKKKKKKRKLNIEGPDSEEKLGTLPNKKLKSNIMNSDSEQSVSANEESGKEESTTDEESAEDDHAGNKYEREEGGSEESNKEESSDEKSDEEESDEDDHAGNKYEKEEGGSEESNKEESSDDKSDEEESDEEKIDDEESGQNKKESEEENENSEAGEDTRSINFIDEEIIDKYSGDSNGKYLGKSEKITSLKMKSNNTSKKLTHKKNEKLPEQNMKNNSNKKTGNKSNSSTIRSPVKKSDSIKLITPKVVDPFFVTSTNEEYVTSQVPSAVENNDSSWEVRNNKFESRGLNRFQTNNRNWGGREDFRGKHNFNKHSYKKPPFNPSFEGTKVNKVPSTIIFGNRKERRKALQQPVKEEKPEKLHPSWEAKKKLSTIANFQGKRITFD